MNTKQECFEESIPEAIKHACYEMDTSCLDVQFKRVQRQKEMGRAGSVAVSPRISGGRSSSEPRSGSHGNRNGGVGDSSGRGESCNKKAYERSKRASGGTSDARSRLGGATANRLGGSTAVMAVIAMKEEVRGW